MWTLGAVASYAKGASNYSLVNVNNMYNFMYNVMETLTDEQKEKYVQNLKINMGMTIFEQFKQYVFKKVPNSPLLKFMQ